MSMPPELLWISILRALVEVAGFSLLGQGIVAIFAGAGRQNNFVYRLFQVITSPVIKGVRFITPRFVADAHVPLVAFLLLFWAWVILAWLRLSTCAELGLVCK